tara:strand:- start:803 stop:1645 length:843 start_codon:yes stop_codon:yes gene_type:complete
VRNSLIITGGTGFIGSSFIRKLTKEKSNDEIILVGEENKRTANNLEQINIDQLGGQLAKIKNNKVSVFHFATFYSKKNEDKESIFEANINFGKSLLDILDKTKVKKFLYTNTMFAFNELESNHYYTKTKIEFSNILKDYFKNSKSLYSEVFLDNTFGVEDRRNKIVSQIVSSILRNDDNPVLDKEIYINLSYVEDILNCFIKEYENNENGKTRITSKLDVRLYSLYKFLQKYHQEGLVDRNSLEIRDSEHLLNRELPSLNQNFNESDIFENLAKVMDRAS